jgi:hypothetical protein
MSGLVLSIHTAEQLDYTNQHAGNKRRYVSAMESNDQRGGRGRARQGGGRIGQRSGRSGGWRRDGRGRGRDNERKTLLTLTGISPRTTGNALGLCAHMSCNYKTAAVVASEEATRVTKGAIQIEPPAAVCLQRRHTLTMPLTQQMCRPTRRLCPKFQSKDPRTVAVSAVAPSIPDLWGPVAHIRYKRSFRVHGGLAPNSITPRKLSLAILASTKLTTMPTPRVLAQIGA